MHIEIEKQNKIIEMDVFREKIKLLNFLIIKKEY
jgi:hypothetical protein